MPIRLSEATAEIVMLGFAKGTEEVWDSVNTLNPDDYVAAMRYKAAQHELDSWNEVGTGAEASIDENGDIEIKIVDEEAYLQTLMADHGIDITMAQLIATNKKRGDESLKVFRNRIKQLASYVLRWTGKYATKLEKVPVDVLQDVDPNAGACPVPGGGDVIFVNEGFHHLRMWHIWNVISANVPEKWDGPIPTYELFKMRVAPHVLHPKSESFRLTEELYKSASAEIEEHKLDRAYVRQRLSDYVTSTLQFLLLHEFGHVALGHTYEARDWPKSQIRLSDSERNLLIQRMHVFEFEADRFAVEAFVSEIKKQDDSDIRRRMIYALMTNFADFFLLIEFGNLEFFQAPQESGRCTHPASIDRSNAALKHLKSIAGADADILPDRIR